MKLLFYQYAERIYRDEKGNHYTSGSFPQSVWDRYLSLCDELIVLMREGEQILDSNTASQYKQPIKMDAKLTIRLMPDKYKGLQIIQKDVINKINLIQDEAIEECDCAIIRGASSDIITKLKKKNKPYMIEVVGCTWDALWNHGWKGKILAVPSFLGVRKEVKEAPWVLYVSNKFLQKRYPSTGQTCACSDVVIEPQKQEVLTKRLKKIEGLKEKIVIGTIGAVDVSYKGQKYIIEALAYLKKQGDTRYLYQMVGGGDQSKLKQLAIKMDVESQVEFLGQLPHEQVFSWLEQIDIYIQPSLTEGLPRSVIEAMSMGVPVYGSNVGGMSELISEKALFPPKRSKNIFKILSDMTKDKLAKFSVENFNNAKEYLPDILNKKRKKFYVQYIMSIKKDRKA